MKRPDWALPFVSALAPVLALYANNSGQARLSETLAPMAVLVVLTALLFPLAARVFRSRLRGAVVLSLFWIVLFSYGHAASLMGRFVIAGHNLANYKLLLPLVGVAGVLAALAIRRARNEPRTLAGVLWIVSIVLLATSVVTAVRFQLSRPRMSAPASSALPDERIAAGTILRKPDIYYFIFDRYGSAPTLRTQFDWDNRPFLDSLRTQGFVIDDEARANYLVTAQSLASSLNLTHITGLTQVAGATSTDWVPVFDLIKDNRLTAFLKSIGYRYVHLGPDWAPTATNPRADATYNYRVLPEFSMMLLSTTAVYPVLYRMGVNNPDLEKYRRINHQLEAMRQIPAREQGPKFVFAHMLLPHGPYVFNRDGSFRSVLGAGPETERADYREQVMFLNGKLLEVAAVIRAAYPADAQPVIVFQGDEGPYPPRTQPHSFVWTEATDAEINEKMRILNAVYAPGCEALLRPGMTPVNTFRVVFNHFFGTGLAELPDHSYTYRDLKHLYDFVDVTERIDRFAH